MIDNQIAHQRRNLRMDALIYLPTREVMTKERSSEITLPMKRLSQGINWGRGSYLWTPG